MPIKWSALKVREAADMMEEFINQAAEPLEQARIVVKAAGDIADVPQYIQQVLNGILAEIERVTGGESSWKNEHYDGSIKRAIDRLRDSLPIGVADAEQERLNLGSTPSLI